MSFKVLLRCSLKTPTVEALTHALEIGFAYDSTTALQSVIWKVNALIIVVSMAVTGGSFLGLSHLSTGLLVIYSSATVSLFINLLLVQYLVYIADLLNY